MVRRPTVELKAIIMRERVFASPPPAPAGTTLREWFAGLAMGNPEIMKDIEPEARILEALRVADELIKALSSPRSPTLESMAAPSEEEMQAWDEAVAEAKETKERQSRATIPELKAKRPGRTKTLMGVAIDPNAQSQSPARNAYQMQPRAGSIPPPKPLPAREPGLGRYTVVNPPTQRPGKKP